MYIVLMKHQILRTCMRKPVWQLEKRIHILGLKELTCMFSTVDDVLM